MLNVGSADTIVQERALNSHKINVREVTELWHFPREECCGWTRRQGYGKKTSTECLGQSIDKQCVDWIILMKRGDGYGGQASTESSRLSGIDIIKLIVSIAACEGAGGIGAIFTTPAIATWYASLKKPTFTPPNSVFGPVWITLYLLMGIAVFLVWHEGLGQEGVTTAFIVFWIQLVLNILWSVIFFGLKSIIGGMITILLLWSVILVNIVVFFGVSPIAGGLLIPYLVWVTIAANLNVRVWILNR
jgi:benzodiazapine receptor